MAKGRERDRRMAIRRDIGNRRPPEEKTKTYPVQYLIAHACFACRKSFKVHSDETREAHCPECGKPLYCMGRSFKTPKQKDKEQWRKVQALYAYGFRFSSYRSSDCEPLPEEYSDVDDFVRRNPNHPLRVALPNKALQPITK